MNTAAEPDEPLARFVEYRQTKDRRLRDEIMSEHLGLAIALARRFAGRGEAVDDLEQIATLGLLKAVERFEPERGLAFSTFATPTISGEIKRHFRDKSWSVRVPRALQELGLRLTATVGDLTNELGRSPTVAEIAARIEVEPEAVLEAMEANRAFATQSLDAQLPGDDRTLGETLGGDEPGMDQVENEMVVDDLLAMLPERDALILRLRFFEGLTQTEIAAQIGISQMHV
ncbi:MAG: SigB/SigF/SigG family RNA polymerase sigma factor, partial [Acidimicrobiia bacterium]